MARKKSKKNSSLLIAIVIFLLALFDIYVIPMLEQEPYEDKVVTNVRTPSPATQTVDGELQIHYLDVGQADSTLITLNDQVMLIDAGNSGSEAKGGDGDFVVSYLRNLGISSIDYVIGTHPHEDHVGGMSKVISNFDIDTILMPKVAHTPNFYTELLDTIDKKNYSITTPNVGDTYKFSDAEFQILSCKNEQTEDLNTTSIVIRLTFGEQSYIFCADAEKENEYEMMDSGLTLKSNVIKIGHHGSTTSSLEKFILAVNPEVAIISVGEDNSYGHPHDKIVNRLNRLKIETYRTDKHGTIILTSDGKTNKITVEKGGII